MKKILASLRLRRRAKPAAPEEPAGLLRLRGLRLRHFGLVAGLGAVAVAVAALAAAYLQYEQGVAQRAAQDARHRADVVAARIGPRVAGYRELVAVAAKRAGLVEAFGAGSGAREAAAREVAAGVPGARYARLLPAGGAPSDLGYAGRELLRQTVEGGEPAPAEVLGLAGDDPYLALTAPVAGPDGVVGTLLVAVAPDRIERWLGRVADGGYAELRQGGGDGALLAAAGNAARKGAVAPVGRAVPGTAWHLAYWPAPVAGVSPGERMRFLVIGGAAVAALVLLALGVTLTLGRRLRRDLDGMLGHCEELLDGRRSHAFVPRLLEVKRAALAAEQLIEHVRRPHVDAAATEPLPAHGMYASDNGIHITEMADEENWPSAEEPGAGDEKRNEPK